MLKPPWYNGFQGCLVSKWRFHNSSIDHLSSIERPYNRYKAETIKVMLIKCTRKHHSIIGSVQLLMWWNGVAIFNQNELIYNVQYWNSTTIVVCSRKYQATIKNTYIFDPKVDRFKILCIEYQTYTNEIVWLRCSKKSDTATALEVKMQCLSFSVYHVSETSMQVKGQSTLIYSSDLPCDETNCKNAVSLYEPVIKENHHCAYEKCENHL